MSQDHRLTIRLDDNRHARLVAAARKRGMPVAAVVREAIDRELLARYPRRRAALSRILSADPMPVPDVSALAEELTKLRARCE